MKKCEANALVIAPEVGRQLCRDAILEHVPIAKVKKYEKKLLKLREELKQELARHLGGIE